tara:strand:- start:5123 stop:5908 length:786 start_codon:yes stop_codon:yes gene_type:complete
MKINLKNKVALITGASQGMGFEIAKCLAMHGAKVFLVSRNKKNLIKAVNIIKKNKGNAEYCIGDISKKKTHQNVFKACQKKFGNIDILVNNSGGPPMGTILEHDESAWDMAIQTNMLSVVRFSKLVLPIMKKKCWGRIITITSTVTKEPSPEMVLSATTRGGLSAFSKAIALEYAKFNITANNICPGGVLTDRLHNLFKEKSIREKSDYNKLLENAQKSIAANRFAEPEEIANIVLFLTSEYGSYINGVSLSVDGSLTKGY